MLLGFKKRFIRPIEKGSKVFTIRTPRKVEPKVGEQLHMYTGLRTSSCKLITRDHRLKSTQQVDIEITVHGPEDHDLKVTVDGRELRQDELYGFAVMDGFDSVSDFVLYWYCETMERQISVKGLTIYHWIDLRL